MEAINYDIQFSEVEQVKLGADFFSNLGYRIYTEVPIFSASADMIIIDSNKNIQAVEFKLKNWKRAIKQVKNHSIVVDYISICILKPKKQKTRLEIEEHCSNEGIGLYYVDRQLDQVAIEQVVSGNKIKTVWEVEKERLLEYIK
ncbi:hypothetical protein HB952_03065 [Listeria welshimeri]|nr:hypothetical protein [Listeria welshimeri]MBC1626818.1 hypothetical protein [Listeria welshimeri]